MPSYREPNSCRAPTLRGLRSTLGSSAKAIPPIPSARAISEFFIRRSLNAPGELDHPIPVRKRVHVLVGLQARPVKPFRAHGAEMVPGELGADGEAGEEGAAHQH